METSRLTWRNPFEHWSTRSAFFGQTDQNASVNLELSKSQRQSKSLQNNIFMLLHQTWVTQRFSSTLTKFDPRLTARGTKNPNFDPTIIMDWGQCYCKYYWIPFPITIHGSKSELKRLRYLENCAGHVNSLYEAITFDSTVGISISLVFWKLNI